MVRTALEAGDRSPERLNHLLTSREPRHAEVTSSDKVTLLAGGSRAEVWA